MERRGVKDINEKYLLLKRLKAILDDAERDKDKYMKPLMPHRDQVISYFTSFMDCLGKSFKLGIINKEEYITYLKIYESIPVLRDNMATLLRMVHDLLLKVETHLQPVEEYIRQLEEENKKLKKELEECKKQVESIKKIR